MSNFSRRAGLDFELSPHQNDRQSQTLQSPPDTTLVVPGHTKQPGEPELVAYALTRYWTWRPGVVVKIGGTLSGDFAPYTYAVNDLIMFWAGAVAIAKLLKRGSTTPVYKVSGS